MKNPLTFAKIIPTPTLSAWSQAYNAGNLAAVVSLTQNPSQDASLPVIGKDILNTLEAEYFTLETKNLTTVKQAVQTTVEKIEDTINVSLCVAVLMENVLYVCIYGKGKALMKRKNKLGVLLEQNQDNTLISGSGYIESGDIVILETDQFARLISHDMLLPCLEHEKLPEIAETLFPILHEKQAGNAAAVAFSYTEEKQSLVPDEKEINEGKTEQKISNEIISEKKDVEKKKEKKNVFVHMHLSHSRKLFLTIILIILIVLGGSIYFATKKQKQTVANNLYQTTVVPAQKKYDEGKSLLDLNKNLALDDFQKAKSILTPAKGKFPPESKENQDAVLLMKKIDDALAGTSPAQTQSTPTGKSVDASVSNTLSALLKYSDEKYVNHNGTTVYLANNDGVLTAAGKTLIKNNTDWKDIGGFETYLGNIYLLDKSAGIFKYVSTGNNYSKSNYFSGTAPDLSKAAGIAIDGSIWILSTDGTILKYTHGSADSFTLKNLDKPFKNPSRIFTSIDANNVYILDNGNSRIAVLDKNGNFLTSYPDSSVSSAQDFDVFESQKKIYVLSSGKVWEVDLK